MTSILDDMVDNGDPGAWQPTGEEILSTIEAQSRRRRSDCMAFVTEFVEVYAIENSGSDLDRVWVDLVNEYPWYADDVLHCLGVTLGDSDRVFPELIGEVAVLDVGKEDDDVDRQVYARRWLQNLLDRFRPVFEDLSRS